MATCRVAVHPWQQLAGRLSVRGARSDDRREIGPRHSESWIFVD